MICFQDGTLVTGRLLLLLLLVVVVVVVIEQIDSAPFYLSLFTGYLSIQTT
jgi:hypothetical protein